MIFACASAQTPSPQFEVASIKPSPPPTGKNVIVRSRGGPGSRDPDLFVCENCSISELVTRALGIRNYQLSGPDWIQSARFNISAKIPPGSTREQFRLMLQNLLAERFKMAFHRDKKPMQTYELVVMKNGPKFKPSGQAPAPDGDAPRQPGPSKTDANGFPVLAKGKGVSIAVTDNRVTMHDGGATMPDFAERLADELTQPVTDATGLNGKYDITLSWVEGAGPDSPGPTLFQALQEQLGLKLEPKKGMVDIVVIDHLEKTPTEN